MSEHPTPAELAAFARGGLPRRSFSRVARHLLGPCSSCRVLLAPHYAHLLPAELVEPRADRERVHDDLLDRALSVARATKRQVQREEARRRRIAAILARGGLEALLSGTDLPVQGVGTLRALLDHSWTLRHENTQEMIKVARFAADVAGRLDSRHCDLLERADWQARAWAELANAHRAADDLDEAERAFGIAFDFLVQGTGDPRLKAKLYDLHASYHGTRRQFTLAFAALEIVHQTYEELGESHLAGRALLVKAVYTFYEGDIEKAVELNGAGLKMIDKQQDLELFLMSVHNRILLVLESGRYRDARKELFYYLAELSNTGGRVYALRLLWLRARISFGLKEWDRAEQAFLEVKRGWEEMGMKLAAALASLELALIWMRHKRYSETQTLVLESAKVFIDLRIQREALGAVMILRDAFSRQLGTFELLEDVVSFLRRWHLDPNTKFEPRTE